MARAARCRRTRRRRVTFDRLRSCGDPERGFGCGSPDHHEAMVAEVPKKNAGAGGMPQGGGGMGGMGGMDF
jgi:hypothetical protein